jgi:hypothetical protein
MAPSTLLKAHKAGLRLLELGESCTKLVARLGRGVQPTDPAFDDVDSKFEELDAAIAEAEANLTPHLPDFAAVSDAPITRDDLTASSAHQLALKVCGWLYDRGWNGDDLRAFNERYYDCELGGTDWDKAIAANDKTLDGSTRFDFLPWAELVALQELEYAKAAKRGSVLSEELPKLSEAESKIYAASTVEFLTGQQIADRAGLDYSNSNIRRWFTRMVEKGVLEKGKPKGYRRAL